MQLGLVLKCHVQNLYQVPTHLRSILGAPLLPYKLVLVKAENAVPRCTLHTFRWRKILKNRICMCHMPIINNDHWFLSSKPKVCSCMLCMLLACWLQGKSLFVMMWWSQEGQGTWEVNISFLALRIWPPSLAGNFLSDLAASNAVLNSREPE